MQKNSITNKITPCCGLPFSVIYWWVSNLTLNSESDRQFILSKISQGGMISIDAWKVLINSGTLEADASLTKAEFLAWFDCGKQPTCEQLKLIIEGYKMGSWVGDLNEISFVNVLGNLKITDTAPTTQGLYILADVGTYANIGGLVAAADKLNYAYFDGTTWSKVEVALPNAITNFDVTNNLQSATMKATDSFYDDFTFFGKPSSKNVLNPSITENLDKRLVYSGLVTVSGYYTSQFIEWGENTHATTTQNGGWEQYDENFVKVNYHYASPTASVIVIPKHASAKYLRVSILTTHKNSDGVVFISAGDAATYALYSAAYNAGKTDSYKENVISSRSGVPTKFSAVTTQKIEKTNSLPVESKTIYNEVFPDQTKLVTISRNVFNPYYKDGEGFRIAYPNQTGVDYYTCDLIEWGDKTELRLVQCAGHCQYSETGEELSKSGIGETGSVTVITKNPNAKWVRVSVPNAYRYSTGAVLGTEDDYNTYRYQPFKVGSNYVSKLDYPVSDFSRINKYKTIEDFQNEQNKGMALCGNILVKSNKSKHKPISNSNTQLDYDVLNFERLKPQGIITHRKHYSVGNQYLHYISPIDGKVYWAKSAGTGYNRPLVSDTIEDFINGVYTDISGNFPITLFVVGLRELDNGELLLLHQQDATNGGNGVWVSSGWADGKKTNTPPTWEKKFNYLSKANGQMDSWGCSIRGNKILISEYCTNRVEDSAVWYSKDYGKTFTQVASISSLNQYSGDSTDYKQHIHGCAIDPYWNRLWIMLGEAAKTGQNVIVYSDDEGVTWKAVSTNAKAKGLVGGGYISMKYCGAYAYKSGLAMGTDSQPNGIWRYNRNDKDSDIHETSTMNIEEAKRVDLFVSNSPNPDYSGHERTITHVMGYTFPDPTNSYYLVSMNYSGLASNTYEQDMSSLLYFTCDGVYFYEIYREEDLVNYPNREGFLDNNFKGFVLKDGRVVIFSNGSGRNSGSTLIIGKMPNLF